MREKPEYLEVVLTGRNPDESLVELADYVSEICKVKHPFDRGNTGKKRDRVLSMVHPLAVSTMQSQIRHTFKRYRGSQVRILHNTRCCIGGAMFRSEPLGLKFLEGRDICDDT